jgi:hypothetical protein
MINVIYDPSGEIRYYVESTEGLILEPGETIQEINVTFEEFAARFTLSHKGQTCQTVYAHAGDPPVEINVTAPGYASASVDVNGQAQTIPLTNGAGTLFIPTSAPGRFALAPTDRRAFCAAGNGSILVVIFE